MEEWAKTDSAQETQRSEKEAMYNEILEQLEEIRHNFKEFWNEYGPELTTDDLAEIHHMCRDLELRMLVRFCNRLEE